MSESDQTRSTRQEINNVIDVSVRTATETPSAFLNELHDDFTKRTGETVVKVAEGAAIGIAGTLLLKSPNLSLVAGGLGALYTGYKTWESGSDFISRASQADSASARESLAQDSAKGLGQALSTAVESGAGMVGGAWGISRAYGAPPLYTRMGDILDRNVLNPARETYAFRGPGSMRLPASLVNEKGELDAVGLSKILNERHPWTGVETGSSVDLDRMRISRIVSGTENGLGHLPGSTRPSVVTYHTHGPLSTAGDLPSDYDPRFARGLAMLGHGDVTTFYTGQSEVYSALAKMGQSDHFAPSLQAISIDNTSGAAWRTEGEWLPGLGRTVSSSTNLDTPSFLQMMSRVRNTNPWPAMSGIAAKTGA